jgi:hypothetical protein
MPENYDLIADLSGNGSSGTIDILSIPQTYKALYITFMVTTNVLTTAILRMSLDTSSSSNDYGYINLGGKNNFVYADNYGGTRYPADITTDQGGMANGYYSVGGEIFIPDYTNTYSQNWHASHGTRFYNASSHSTGTKKSGGAVINMKLFLSSGGFTSDSRVRVYGLV